ncbi:MAG TPA: 4-hydroxy-tetrahydrodipicolinate synthase [Smithellaceae bacterium]|nr:4-hydroxy-tetrahydrodipicolinate synthase [Smithellaceae bacterium]
MFKGAITALVTPFKNGQVDEKALRELIEFQIVGGVDGLVPCGTTGESPTLTHDEHDRVIEITIDAARKRVPVIAGTGSNSTAEALRLTKHAYEAGADGALIACPYYNKPTQEGLYQHFQMIAQNVPIPIIPYNIPGRTGVNMSPELIARLAKINNIVGVKEASGSLKQMNDVLDLCGPDFDVLSGDDGLTLPLMAIGGRGIISVASNIVPADMAALVDSVDEGSLANARALHQKMSPLFDVLFVETNPIPVKAALSLMGKIEYEYRLPLCKMAPANYDNLKKVMGNYGLLS